MDLDAKFTWSELLALASNRNEWRTRVKALRSGASMQKPPRKPTPTTKHHYNTRSKIKTTSPTDSITSPTVRTPTATTSDNTTRQKRAKPSATMYPLRDAHEAFFRPNKDSGKRKCQVNRPRRKKRKKTSLTDKQRAAAQRDYYDRHHAPRSDHSEDITTTPPPTSRPTTPIAWTPPAILGHHQHQNNFDTTVAPIDFHSFFEYSPEADRRALQDFSVLCL